MPINDRVNHFDATGGLIKIKGDCSDYGIVFTYALVVQNLERLNQGKYLLLSETSISSHDTESITKMLVNIQFGD